MTEKKEFKFTLEWFRNISYIFVTIGIALMGLLAFHGRALVLPIKHQIQYIDRELNEIGIKLNKMDDEVDNNRHAIAILNSHSQRIK